jgi:hypothetical protein
MGESILRVGWFCQLYAKSQGPVTLAAQQIKPLVGKHKKPAPKFEWNLGAGKLKKLPIKLAFFIVD